MPFSLDMFRKQKSTNIAQRTQPIWSISPLGRNRGVTLVTGHIHLLCLFVTYC